VDEVEDMWRMAFRMHALLSDRPWHASSFAHEFVSYVMQRTNKATGAAAASF
jgi:hypothetical protein